MFTLNYGNHDGTGGCEEFTYYADAVDRYFEVAGCNDFSEIWDTDGMVVLSTVG